MRDITELHSDLRPERSGMAGMVEVTFLSLKSVYSILDRYRFPLVRSEVSCLCDCPGGAAHCHPGLDLCQNQVVKIFLRWKYFMKIFARPTAPTTTTPVSSPAGVSSTGSSSPRPSAAPSGWCRTTPTTTSTRPSGWATPVSRHSYGPS